MPSGRANASIPIIHRPQFDIAWKIRLSDESRRIFGIFGSECGREWALPHSDFFEGLVGVSGRYYHQLNPDAFGAQVIPFWEMVYHDCQIAYGKYGYSAANAGSYVAHHVLSARTASLSLHSEPSLLAGNPRGKACERCVCRFYTLGRRMGGRVASNGCFSEEYA
jgi:hypothetical protein